MLMILPDRQPEYSTLLNEENAMNHHERLKASLPKQADPRKPVRPEGEAGANWVRCRQCWREAPTLKLLRHAKHCAAA